MAFVATTLIVGCSGDEPGAPYISYVRVTNPAASDSLLAAAPQGQTVAIIGGNLQSVRQIWFNNQMAETRATFVTGSSIITKVPTDIPTVISNKLKLIFANGDSLLYDFAVAIAKPVIDHAKCEYANDGDSLTVIGNYFYKPLTVTFTGGGVADVIDISEDAKTVIVKVPSGAQPGPITIKSNFGSATSSFHFRDDRNIFLNYDDKTAAGSWRPGPTASVNGIEGNYLVLKGVLGANERSEDYPGGAFESEFWAKANGRAPGNLFDGDPAKFSMKFECDVITWYGSYLNICFAPYTQADNSEVWGNALNARAIWGPWDVADKPYQSNGWITVVVPITEFKYAMGTPGGVVTYTPMAFNPSVTSSLSFWILGGPKANASPVELHIDNVRIVPNSDK